MPSKKPVSLEVAVALLTQKIDDLTDFIKIEHKEDMQKLELSVNENRAELRELRENQIRFAGTMKILKWGGGIATAVLTSGLIALMFDAIGKLWG